MASQEPDSGYARLEQQIAWYDTRSGEAQRRYKAFKVAELILAAVVPIAASSIHWLAAIAGASVLIIEAVIQLNQWSHNWITYRSTCEDLRHEKYSYLGRTGEYESKDDDEARRILVDRVESLVSTEHSKWVSRQETSSDSGHVKR